jgi:hypothetical protein
VELSCVGSTSRGGRFRRAPGDHLRARRSLRFLIPIPSTRLSIRSSQWVNAAGRAVRPIQRRRPSRRDFRTKRFRTVFIRGGHQLRQIEHFQSSGRRSRRSGRLVLPPGPGWQRAWRVRAATLASSASARCPASASRSGHHGVRGAEFGRAAAWTDDHFVPCERHRRWLPRCSRAAPRRAQTRRGAAIPRFSG